jgi:plasmid stabilization system protein ParE
MRKPIRWSSFAENDFALILEYLNSKWNKTVCNNFIEIVDTNLLLIQKNPKLFPFLNKELNIRKCVITKHSTLFYRDKENKIEILRLYDNRQNPNTLKLF